MSRINRINRALNQKLYLVKIDHKDATEADIPYLKFHIMGTLKNVYDVICNDNELSCNCHDALNNNHYCKHIYFIFYRIMNHCTCINMEHISTISLFDRFVDKVFTAKISKEFIAPKNLRDMFDLLSSVETNTVEQREILGNSCPICFEDFTQNDIDENKISYCYVQCGKNFHTSCFDKWIEVKKNASCVFCRTTLHNKNKYINLRLFI